MKKKQSEIQHTKWKDFIFKDSISIESGCRKFTPKSNTNVHKVAYTWIESRHHKMGIKTKYDHTMTSNRDGRHVLHR